MPAPGAPKGMGGMSPPGGEVPDEIAQMMAGGSAGSNSVKSAASSSSPVGTIKDEIKRGAKDVFQEIKDFFTLETWLGIKPAGMDPQQQAKSKQLHSRYQNLDQEQQMVARKMYQEKMQRKQAEDEQAARKKQMEAQRTAQAFETPSGPSKGAKNQGQSGKQRVATKLQQDRTTLSTTLGE
jgi:hypothetical protein